jgi:membrane-associated phospholipid phosphatase
VRRHLAGAACSVHTPGAVTAVLPFLIFLAGFLVLWASCYALLPGFARGLRRVASRLARVALRMPRLARAADLARARTSRFAAYLPVALLLIGGLLITAAAGDAFLDLGELVHAKSPKLQRVDATVHDWAVTRRSPAATLFFTVVTKIGSPVGAGVIAGAASILLAVRKRLRWACYVAGTNIGGAFLETELKRHFARSRPSLEQMMMSARGFSFPSGHAMGTTIVLMTLTYVALRGLPRWRYKAAVLAFACCFIAAVDLSRIYLGAHWISDVAAGTTIGAVWVIVTTTAYETFRRIHGVRKAVISDQ